MADHPIYPHGPLEKLSEGVWRVKGTLSMPLMRNMIALKLPDGTVLLHSVVALDAAGLSALEALGPIAYVVVPHDGHQLDTSFYRERFPAAKILAPETAREAVAARGRLDGTVEMVMPGLGFTLHLAPGTKIPEYVYEWPLPAGGRLLMLSDLLGGTGAADRTKFMGRTLIGLITAARQPLGVTRIYRWTMAKDLAAIRQFAHGLADIPDIRLITVSHGKPVRQNCAAALRAV
jgi:hypothetical protein